MSISLHLFATSNALTKVSEKSNSMRSAATPMTSEPISSHPSRRMDVHFSAALSPSSLCGSCRLHSSSSHSLSMPPNHLTSASFSSGVICRMKMP